MRQERDSLARGECAHFSNTLRENASKNKTVGKHVLTVTEVVMLLVTILVVVVMVVDDVVAGILV